jgi:hypothetical protein
MMALEEMPFIRPPAAIQIHVAQYRPSVKDDTSRHV